MYVKKELGFFTARLKKVVKKYPLSTDYIDGIINSLKGKPTQGDIYPGFGELSVRKMRIGLPEYKIGKRKGLRLLHLSIDEKKKVAPLTIYAKKDYGSEAKVKKEVIMALQEALLELES